MAVAHSSDPDEQDYDRFFDDCLPSVLNLARRMTGSVTEAEDVAVEALGRAYAHWSRVRHMANAQAWVLRVTINLVIGGARRHRRIPVAPEPPLVDVADAVTVRVALVMALETLPRRQREAVALRYLVDLPEKTVADAMGVTAGSVKKHLSRGLASLRNTLGAEIEQGVWP
jgi:RNA polymerase sigma-70 factor (sigma-E family)